jgi:hypothetical protein
MSGPYSPHRGMDTGAPPSTGSHPSQVIPAQQAYAAAPASAAVQTAPSLAAYPGLLPPPVPYPKRRLRPLVLGALTAVAVIAAMTTAIIYGTHRSGTTSGGTISDIEAKTAIQGYLDALERRNTETIARNTLCGIYDAIRDRRPDQALAKLSSDAFRKQFSEAQVTSIDKIVYWSNYEAQVLFSMRVKPATSGALRDEVQGIGQLLRQRNQVLVCSYVLRTAGTY